MGSKICSIMVLEKNQQELRIIATQSLSQEYLKKGNIKVGQSISGKVVQDKKPMMVLDVTAEETYAFKEIAKREGLVSMLAVPMMLKGKANGVINIYTAQKHVFTGNEIKILQTVANQAAIGIENEKLSEETMLAKDALEARKLIDRAKGILMQRFKMAEDAAYKTIHKKSMDSRKSMKEVAEAIILAMELEK
jgi:signal transduction protein with GAF and PtsI domain